MRSGNPLLGAGPGVADPNKPELDRVDREVKFFVGVGYLNLSYVRPTMLQKLYTKDVLSLSHPGSDSRSPPSFAIEAKYHLCRVSAPRVLALNATDEAKAFDVCMILALAEVRLVISLKGIRHAWRLLFEVLTRLTPNYPASKLARRAVRLRMQSARKLWATYHHFLKMARVEDDGHSRGRWFRSNISRGMVKELMDKQLRQEAVAKYGDAVFAHPIEWARDIQGLPSEWRLSQRSRRC